MTRDERRQLAGKLIEVANTLGRRAGGSMEMIRMCTMAAAEISEIDAPVVLDLDEFIACMKPCWIEHRTLPTYCGWALYYAEQLPLLKIDYLRIGRVLLSPDTYRKQWVALTNEPTREEKEALWRIRRK